MPVTINCVLLPLQFHVLLTLFVRDCLYREKDVGGGLCHCHISHLVHPKTLISDRLEHAKK